MKAGNSFIHNGKTYNCVGLDGGMVWGVENEYDEAKPFEPSECTLVNEFTKALDALYLEVDASIVDDLKRRYYDTLTPKD